MAPPGLMNASNMSMPTHSGPSPMQMPVPGMPMVSNHLVREFCQNYCHNFSFLEYSTEYTTDASTTNAHATDASKSISYTHTPNSRTSMGIQMMPSTGFHNVKFQKF